MSLMPIGGSFRGRNDFEDEDREFNEEQYNATLKVLKKFAFEKVDKNNQVRGDSNEY